MQMTHKIIPSFTHPVCSGAAETVPAMWKHKKIEILVCFDQSIYHEQCIRLRYVAVHHSMGDEKFSLEVFSQKMIGLVVVVCCAVGIGLQESLPLLAPIVFIISVVMIAGARDSDFIEIRVTENSVGRCESSS